MKRTLFKSLFIAALVLSMIVVSSISVSAFTFTDVTNYKEAIETLSSLEIIKGYNTTTFAPNDNITRVQMAIMLSKLRTGDVTTATWSAATNLNIPFSDVSTDPNAYHYPSAIMYAYNNSIIKGRGDGTFDPTATITVQEAAVMIVRALYYPASIYDSGDWSANYIGKADELGIFDGVSSLKYSPTTVLNRGQVAQMLYNALYATMYGSTTTTTKTLAETVFNIKTGVKMVLVATSNQKLIAGVNKTTSGYVLMAELNANGTYGTTHTYKASDLGISSPDSELGTMYTIKSSSQNGYSYELVSSYTKGTSNSYNTGITSVSSATGTLTFGGNTYTLVNSYSYSLEDGKSPGSRQLIVYGLNDLYSSLSSNILSAASIENKTAAYTLKTFDDNADGIPDRAIFTPYSIGKYTKENDHIMITSNGTTKIDKVSGAITVTSNTNKTYTSGDYVLYSYNPQTMVLEIGDVFTKASGMITNYANGMLIIGNSTYTLGYAQLPGASYNEIIVASQNVLTAGSTISYVTYGSYIIAIDTSVSTSTTYESYKPTAVVTAIDKTKINAGYLTLTVSTYAGLTELTVTSVNGYEVESVSSLIANMIAVGDIVEYTQGNPLLINGQTTLTYSVSNITSTASYYTTTSTGVLDIANSTLGYFSLGSTTAGTTTTSKFWTTAADVKIVYNNGTTFMTYALGSFPIDNLPSGYSVYISYGAAKETSVKMIYIRPSGTTSTGTSGSQTITTYDKLVYLSESVIQNYGISLDYTSQTIVLTFKNGFNALTGEVIPSLTYSSANGSLGLTAGFYKVNGTTIIDGTPVTSDTANEKLLFTVKEGGPNIVTNGSYYQVVFGNALSTSGTSSYIVSNLKIYCKWAQSQGVGTDIYCDSTGAPINYLTTYMSSMDSYYNATSVTTVIYDMTTSTMTLVIRIGA